MSTSHSHVFFFLESGKVSDYQEHEDTGEQHASNHDEFILSGSPLYYSHDCVRKP